MTTPILTLALTLTESAFIKALLRTELPARIHAIVTAQLMDEKEKTEALTALFDDFHSLSSLLTWQASDEGRAYRQVNSAAIQQLHELMTNVNEGSLDPFLLRAYKALGTGIVMVLRKAVSLNPNMPALPVSAETPDAKA